MTKRDESTTDLFGGGGLLPKGGYAADSGSGPQGETCKTCFHCLSISYHGKKYYKCGMSKDSRSSSTDIRLKTPACHFWESAK